MSMWDEVLIIVIMGFAFALNLACHNDRHIKESAIMAGSRRVIMVSQLLVIAWLMLAVIEYGDAWLNRSSFFVFMLWGLGSCMGSLDHIARRWGREISELLKPKVYYERRKTPR